MPSGRQPGINQYSSGNDEDNSANGGSRATEDSENEDASDDNGSSSPLEGIFDSGSSSGSGGSSSSSGGRADISERDDVRTGPRRNRSSGSSGSSTSGSSPSSSSDDSDDRREINPGDVSAEFRDAPVGSNDSESSSGSGGVRERIEETYGEDHDEPPSTDPDFDRDRSTDADSRDRTINRRGTPGPTGVPSNLSDDTETRRVTDGRPSPTDELSRDQRRQLRERITQDSRLEPADVTITGVSATDTSEVELDVHTDFFAQRDIARQQAAEQSDRFDADDFSVTATTESDDLDVEVRQQSLFEAAADEDERFGAEDFELVESSEWDSAGFGGGERLSVTEEAQRRELTDRAVDSIDAIGPDGPLSREDVLIEETNGGFEATIAEDARRELARQEAADELGLDPSEVRITNIDGDEIEVREDLERSREMQTEESGFLETSEALFEREVTPRVGETLDAASPVESRVTERLLGEDTDTLSRRFGEGAASAVNPAGIALGGIALGRAADSAATTAFDTDVVDGPGGILLPTPIVADPEGSTQVAGSGAATAAGAAIAAGTTVRDDPFEIARGAGFVGGGLALGGAAGATARAGAQAASRASAGVRTGPRTARINRFIGDDRAQGQFSIQRQRQRERGDADAESSGDWVDQRTMGPDEDLRDLRTRQQERVDSPDQDLRQQGGETRVRDADGAAVERGIERSAEALDRAQAMIDNRQIERAFSRGDRALTRTEQQLAGTRFASEVEPGMTVSAGQTTSAEAAVATGAGTRFVSSQAQEASVEADTEPMLETEQEVGVTTQEEIQLELESDLVSETQLAQETEGITETQTDSLLSTASLTALDQDLMADQDLMSDQATLSVQDAASTTATTQMTGQQTTTVTDGIQQTGPTFATPTIPTPTISMSASGMRLIQPRSVNRPPPGRTRIPEQGNVQSLQDSPDEGFLTGDVLGRERNGGPAVGFGAETFTALATGAFGERVLPGEIPESVNPELPTRTLADPTPDEEEDVERVDELFFGGVTGTSRVEPEDDFEFELGFGDDLFGGERNDA